MIEGFLDILLPEPTGPEQSATQTKVNQSEIRPSSIDSRTPAFEKHATTRPSRESTIKDHSPKPLFTVKPGGIAGYLCMRPIFIHLPYLVTDSTLASLCNTASYVDIKAKTDTYVGFLPANALERLLEKRPIVLLTLAKRLISLLSRTREAS